MNFENLLLDIESIGNYQFGGTYVLEIWIKDDVSVQFGRFKNGQKFHLSSGRYLYIGSAMTSHNRHALLQRLTRHATRTEQHPPLKIRKKLIIWAHQHNINEKNIILKQNKKLHWHIDYVLNNLNVEINNIILIPSEKSYESMIAKSLLLSDSITVPIMGLGATDKKKETHFLHISDTIAQKRLIDRIKEIIQEG